MDKADKLSPEPRTCIKSTGLGSFGDGAVMAAIDVKDGKITRTRTFRYDWRYKPEDFGTWQIEARNQVFVPNMKSPITPFSLGYKKRVHSANRIKYPLKRVDWDPDGERNPQNRGISKYQRISWDEATNIIAQEIRRTIQKYGPEAVLCQADGHGETKVVHSTHGCNTRLMNLLGGYTLQVRNADSWEGWYWGAKHVWGCEPYGTASGYGTNLYPDIAKNTELLLTWGGDPETTPWGFGGGTSPGRFCYWFTDLGIKQIYICPDLNYAAAVHADRWIPIKPNTDAALQLAIAYTWITEGTYDKAYLATHAVGYEKFFDYVSGKEDGLPKTPKWAAEITGVPSRVIKALAREWATKRTTLAHGFGGPMIRGAYSHEPARLEVCLMGMQGLGRPGVNQISMIELSYVVAFALKKRLISPPVPGAVLKPVPMAAYHGWVPFMPLPKQLIPKTMIADAILKGSFEITGSSLLFAMTEDQFKKVKYPAPGCSPIHMIWTDTPCLMTCWNDTNTIAQAYRHPSIEFMLAQHPWLENDCLFADIILPTCTKFEVKDIGNDLSSLTYETLFIEDKCLEPIGESCSDYEAVIAIAEKLGLKEQYTEGKSVDEWIKLGFETSGVPEAGLCQWAEFEEKRYCVIPTDKEQANKPAGMIEFYQNPEKHPLMTPTGKLEYYSQRLAEKFPDDKERQPVPRWIGKGESHDERLSSARASRYPLLCISNHPRWRVHANMDDCSWFHEIPTSKVRGPDGYLYEPCWLHPSTAQARGIQNGDIVKLFNERGGVLAGAYVTERIMPGVAYIDHGARFDPIIPDELDRGGAINTITPHNVTSKNCAGMVTSGFLVEVAGVDLSGLRRQYPEAFNRPYNQASGLSFERAIYRGN